MIGRLEKAVIDCPDPEALAAFYGAVLGMQVNEDLGDWVVIGIGPDDRQLAFQRVATWVPPRWPDPEHPQQLHLDIRVDDIDDAERAVVALGARRVPAARETGFRVFVDPAGHPFCLVFGRDQSPDWSRT
jgi:catechol 2,3-dioxygenase-like lactoylglutathione lyase family enzyme